MYKTRFTLNMLAVFVMCLAFSSAAQAQATRTWVSGVGDDVNPCSRTAPCKTFPGAISKTAAGGEINCLDPAGFGAITITKSISIDCRYTEGGILAASVNGVVINALSTDKIILRGLDINGGGGAGGLDGVRFLAGGTLHVEDTVINNMSNAINVNTTQAGGIEVYITNTYIRNNSNVGIFLASTGGQMKVVLDRVMVQNNAFGLIARNNTRVTAKDSVFSGNTNNGVLAEVQGGAGTAEVNLDSCTVTGNGTGLSAAGLFDTAIIRISNVRVSNNTTGLSTANSNDIATHEDNKIFGNNTDGAPTQTLPKQ